jgi:4-amino-4-deoxy-L-arabinose transferase-like glycosyltransferase
MIGVPGIRGALPASPFWAIAAAVTLARITLLVFAEADLGPDEAQYWFWSREPSFGYFSKPPMVAWAIALSTSVFGDSEWAVRLTAPLFHMGAATFIYLLARRAFNEAAAIWSGLGWLFMPGVALSSFVIATDAPLLFFWSGALYFLYRLYEQRGEESAKPAAFAALGIMIGFGLLSKYAMIYFVIAAAAGLVMSRNLRVTLLRRELFATAGGAALLIAPNIAWNASNQFQTIAHTADIAEWDGSLFHVNSLIEFWGGQFAVFGVYTGAAFLWLLARPAQLSYGKGEDEFEKILLAFTLTPLAIVSAQAFISTANANWAATAYPSAIILVAAWLFRLQNGRTVKAIVAFHAALALIFAVAMLDFAMIDRIGASRAVKEVRGWREQTNAIASLTARDAPYDAIAIDGRGLIAEMLYYQRKSGLEIVAMDTNQLIENHFEAFRPFDSNKHERVLYLTPLEDPSPIDDRFAKVTPLGPQTVEMGAVMRGFLMFDTSGYRAAGAPPARPAATAPTAAPQ